MSIKNTYLQFTRLAKAELMHHSYGEFEGFEDYDGLSLSTLLEMQSLLNILVADKMRESFSTED